MTAIGCPSSCLLCLCCLVVELGCWATWCWSDIVLQLCGRRDERNKNVAIQVKLPAGAYDEISLTMIRIPLFDILFNLNPITILMYFVNENKLHLVHVLSYLAFALAVRLFCKIGTNLFNCIVCGYKIWIIIPIECRTLSWIAVADV